MPDDPRTAQLRNALVSAITHRVINDPEAAPDELAYEALKLIAPLLAERDAEIQRLTAGLSGHRLVVESYQGLLKHLESERDQARAEADVAVKQAWTTRQELVRVKALAALCPAPGEGT
jgi:hypothetical protein